MAVTALSTSALIEAGGDNPRVERAIEDGEKYLFEHLPKLRRATADAMYNVWSHAYAIQTLVRMRARLPKNKARIAKVDALIRHQSDRLDRYESVDGGWGYYDFRVGTKKPASSSISFVNGTVLHAFYEAKQAGIEPPKKLVTRAIAATKRHIAPEACRKPKSLLPKD